MSIMRTKEGREWALPVHQAFRAASGSFPASQTAGCGISAAWRDQALVDAVQADFLDQAGERYALGRQIKPFNPSPDHRIPRGTVVF